MTLTIGVLRNHRCNDGCTSRRTDGERKREVELKCLFLRTCKIVTLHKILTFYGIIEIIIGIGCSRWIGNSGVFAFTRTINGSSEGLKVPEGWHMVPRESEYARISQRCRNLSYGGYFFENTINFKGINEIITERLLFNIKWKWPF